MFTRTHRLHVIALQKQQRFLDGPVDLQVSPPLPPHPRIRFEFAPLTRAISAAWSAVSGRSVCLSLSPACRPQASAGAASACGMTLPRLRYSWVALMHSAAPLLTPGCSRESTHLLIHYHLSPLPPHNHQIHSALALLAANCFDRQSPSRPLWPCMCSCSRLENRQYDLRRLQWQGQRA